MSLDSEVRTLVLSTGLFGEGRMWADRAPEGATTPYATVLWDVSRADALVGDGRRIATARTIQVSLWQRQHDERPERVRDLEVALDGAKLAVAGGATVTLRVSDTVRLADSSADLVQHALTLSVRHGSTVA